MRKRQLLPNDIIGREPRTRMTFAHPCMLLHTFGSQHLGAQDAVTDVGLCAVTTDARRIALHNANVVQHGGLVHKLAVGTQLGMRVADAQSTLCHCLAVHHQYVHQVGLLGVIFVNNLFIYHIE